MIDPIQFLVVGERLSLSDDEPDLRTCVNRAYQAAFLHCREYAFRSGMELRRMAQDHSRVRAAVERLDPDAAARLDTLRRNRNICDYDLDAEIAEDLGRKACELARAIVAVVR